MCVCVFMYIFDVSIKFSKYLVASLGSQKRARGREGERERVREGERRASAEWGEDESIWGREGDSI